MTSARRTERSSRSERSEAPLGLAAQRIPYLLDALERSLRGEPLRFENRGRGVPRGGVFDELITTSGDGFFPAPPAGQAGLIHACWQGVRLFLMRQLLPGVRDVNARSVRELIEQPTSGSVLSLFIDLDPSRFATQPSRIAQFSSLENEARAAMQNLDPADRASVEEGLADILSYLRGPDFPPPGAEGVAVFRGLPDLFEVFALRSPLDPEVAVADRPVVEPLADHLSPEPRWGVLLVNRRSARLFVGASDALRERAVVFDDTHGKHQQGGWSQARYQRSVQKEVDDHVGRAVDAVIRMDRRLPLAHVVIATPNELISGIENGLPVALRERLAGTIDVDVDLSSVEEVQRALEPIAARERARVETEALATLAERVGRGERAAVGIEAVRSALADRRVERVLCEQGWEIPEDVVASALEQKADLLVLDAPMERFRPVAALLRF